MYGADCRHSKPVGHELQAPKPMPSSETAAKQRTSGTQSRKALARCLLRSYLVYLKNVGRYLVLKSIVWYQRILSPHKGFSCANAHHTGCASCSRLGYRVIRRHQTWPEAPRRQIWSMQGGACGPNREGRRPRAIEWPPSVDRTHASAARLLRRAPVCAMSRSARTSSRGESTHPARRTRVIVDKSALEGGGSGPETVAGLNRKHWSLGTGIGGGMHRNTHLGPSPDGSGEAGAQMLSASGLYAPLGRFPARCAKPDYYGFQTEL